MDIQDGFAQFSAGTAPAFRRRGVQSALLALVTVQPGSRSQRNVQRRGFDLLYTRATLVH
jgi:ribosomal protein S18 acetylase RimI-like enzyme